MNGRSCRAPPRSVCCAACGAAINGTGTLAIGNNTLGYSASGLTIASSGYVGTTVAVSAAGGGGVGSQIGNYFVGDLIYDKCTAGVNGCPSSGTYGGQYRVTSVNPSTGGVTGLSVVVKPFTTSGSAPTDTITTSGGSGAGLTLSITWTAANGIALNPGSNGVSINGAGRLDLPRGRRTEPVATCPGNSRVAGVRGACVPGRAAVVDVASLALASTSSRTPQPGSTHRGTRSRARRMM